MGMRLKNESFGTALHRAVSRCDVESVKYLVGHGASLSSRDYAYRTPLDVAHELLFSFKCAAITQNQNSQKNNRLREVERIIRFLDGTLNERTKIQPLVSLMFCAERMTQINLDALKISSSEEENKEEAEEKAEKQKKKDSENWRKICVDTLLPFLFLSS